MDTAPTPPPGSPVDIPQLVIPPLSFTPPPGSLLDIPPLAIPSLADNHLPPVSRETAEFYNSMGIKTSTRPVYDLGMLPRLHQSPWVGTRVRSGSVTAAMQRLYPALFSQSFGLRCYLLQLRWLHDAAARRAAAFAIDPAAAGYREHARAEVERFRALGHANPLLAFHVDCSIKLERHSIQIHRNDEQLSKNFSINEAEYCRRLERWVFAADYYRFLQ